MLVCENKSYLKKISFSLYLCNEYLKLDRRNILYNVNVKNKNSNEKNKD